MATYRTKQKLNSEVSKQSVNTDTFLKIKMDGKEKLLPYDSINEIVNVGEQFNIERQNSKFYRILGTINLTVSNVLFNLSNITNRNFRTWSGFNDILFLDTDKPRDYATTSSTDYNYNESITNNLKELNGWFGFYNNFSWETMVTTYDNVFYDMEPQRSRFSFIPDKASFNNSKTPVKNWELTITYPHHSDKNHEMVKGGLLIIDTLPAIVATKSMTAFGMACLHNLSIGDTIKITGTTGYDGIHTVIRTGLDDGSFKGYYFVLDLPTTGLIGGTSRIKKIIAGNESEYYFRVFKKIKTRSASTIEVDDYETYKLAFSENIYADNICQYVFNEDIDVTDLVDNLGRPLSELYVTKVKTSSDSLFRKVSSGIETPFMARLKKSKTIPYLINVPAINMIHNGGNTPFPTHKPLESQLNIYGEYFYGDLVEYNTYEVKETILANIAHRFNTVNRESTSSLTYLDTKGFSPTTKTIDLGPRQEGYFYYPHQLVRIREFSSYIEQGDEKTEGVPSYAVNIGDNTYLWRDLLDIGYNQSDETALNYPFLNGCHYMYQNENFLVRRQDPFNNWELYYNKFPSDPIGDRISDKNSFNSEEDVC